ncbi:unnamed protein product [Prunus armeniaca]|uniref:Uncharacterized protein n=1 Tax=Prunus armeniaca TaxID=36596 RepID=A0A6J5VF00_PRUAR|nr:unnamed protein product [Prunus armeniaca]
MEYKNNEYICGGDGFVGCGGKKLGKEDGGMALIKREVVLRWGDVRMEASSSQPSMLDQYPPHHHQNHNNHGQYFKAIPSYKETTFYRYDFI